MRGLPRTAQAGPGSSGADAGVSRRGAGFYRAGDEKRFLGKESKEPRDCLSGQRSGSLAHLLHSFDTIAGRRCGYAAKRARHGKAGGRFCRDRDGTGENGFSYSSEQEKSEGISEKSQARDMGQVLSLSPQQAEQLYGLLSEEQRQALEPDGEGSFTAAGTGGGSCCPCWRRWGYKLRQENTITYFCRI